MYAATNTTLPNDLTDAELIDRFRNGADEALEVLLRRYASDLFRFCCRLAASREDAEDICQETLARAMTRLDTLKTGAAFRSWLFSIARNLVRDRGRAARREPPTAAVSDSTVATEHDALSELVAGETAGRLREAITRLTPLQREVFTLRVSEGLSYREIADIVGSTEGAARVHYFNAVRTIKEHIDD